MRVHSYASVGLHPQLVTTSQSSCLLLLALHARLFCMSPHTFSTVVLYSLHPESDRADFGRGRIRWISAGVGSDGFRLESDRTDSARVGIQAKALEGQNSIVKDSEPKFPSQQSKDQA